MNFSPALQGTELWGFFSRESSDVHLPEHLGNSLQSPSFHRSLSSIFEGGNTAGQKCSLSNSLSIYTENPAPEDQVTTSLCSTWDKVLSSRADSLHRSEVKTTRNISLSNLFSVQLSMKDVPKAIPIDTHVLSIKENTSEGRTLHCSNFRTATDGIAESISDKKTVPTANQPSLSLQTVLRGHLAS